jgi:hypothetical protein
LKKEKREIRESERGSRKRTFYVERNIKRTSFEGSLAVPARVKVRK